MYKNTHYYSLVFTITTKDILHYLLHVISGFLLLKSLLNRYLACPVSCTSKKLFLALFIAFCYHINLFSSGRLNKVSLTAGFTKMKFRTLNGLEKEPATLPRYYMNFVPNTLNLRIDYWRLFHK